MSYIKTGRGLDVCLETVDANQVICETFKQVVSGSRSPGVLCTSGDTFVLTLCVTDFCQGLCVLLHYASTPSLHFVDVLDTAQPSPSAAQSSRFCRLSADCCKLLASFLSAITAMCTSLPAAGSRPPECSQASSPKAWCSQVLHRISSSIIDCPEKGSLVKCGRVGP